MSLNQKFTWGGGGGGNTQWQKDKKKIDLRGRGRKKNKNTKKKKKKNDNHTKIPNTKNQKYGEKSFIQRTCKYWSYPGPGLYCYCYCYSHTHKHTHTPSCHPLILFVSAHVSLIGFFHACYKYFIFNFFGWFCKKIVTERAQELVSSAVSPCVSLFTTSGSKSIE